MTRFKDQNYNNMAPFMLTASIPSSGWQGDTLTWQYASASTFNVTDDSGAAGTVDCTALYPLGTRLKWTEGGTVGYGYIVGTAFGTITTITVAGSAFAGGTISKPAKSLVSNPTGFPGAMPWTPTFGGFSTDPTGLHCRFEVFGNVCICWVHLGTAGTSNASTFTISLPIPAKTISGMNWYGYATTMDVGVWQTVVGKIYISSGGTVMNIRKNYGDTDNFTATGGKNAAGRIDYEI